MKFKLNLSRLAALAASATFALTAANATAQSLIRDAEVERTISMMATPILKAAGYAPDSINILLLNDRTLNAFVFGGKNMILNTGLLTRVETPEALMGVIAHEMGHIAGGHLTRRQINAEALQGPLLVGAILAAVAGAASGRGDIAVAGALGVQGAAQRSFLAYTRGEESAADQAGASYMEQAGLDPAASLDVLRIFRGQEVFAAGNVDPYARTHPLSGDRMQLLEDRVARSSAKGGKASEDLHYWHARMRAKLAGFLSRPARTLSILETSENPNSEFNILTRAIAYHLLPSPRDALAEVNRLIELRPNDPYYYELKGQILFESGDAKAAVAPYRKASQLAPNEPLIRGSLGRALLALNDPAANAEALTALEDATRTDPGEIAVLRDLALAYARDGQEGKAALATAQRFAFQSSPKDTYRHATRALDLLPVGSPGWLKADDIRAVAERSIRAKN